MKKKWIIILVVLVLILLLASILIWRNISGNVVESSISGETCSIENSSGCRIVDNTPTKVELEFGDKQIRVA